MGNRKLGVLAMVAALGLAACDTGVAGNDMARVRVLLTDAPGDLAVAEVTISEVYLQGSEGRVTLFTGPATYDLLELQNGVTAELAEVLIPRGQYSQLRMIVQSASITTHDGRTFSTNGGGLICPSCAQTGIKVNLPGGSVRLEEDSEVLLLDFDVAQTFGREAGRSGNWVMHPVVHASDFTTASVIRGQVSLAEGVTLPESCGEQTITREHFVPTATAGEIVVSGRTAADGTFRFSFVAPGTYTLGFLDEVVFDNGDVLDFEATFTPETIEVGASQNLNAAYTITAASCTVAG